MKSTPAWAMSATVCRVMPPDTSTRGAFLDECHGLSHECRRHVVEQNDVGFTGQRFLHFPQALGFYFNAKAVRRSGTSESAGSGHIDAGGAQDCEMVVFDQDAVAQ
jgi:hypothetical protein